MSDDLGSHGPAGPPPPPPPPQQAVYFFLSYDLVNSTQYKAQTKGWHRQIADFYARAANARERFPQQLTVWKFVGDEVLFHVRLNKGDVARVGEYVRTAHDVLLELLATMDAGDCQGILSVKGTAWIAVINESSTAGDDSQGDAQSRAEEGNIWVQHATHPMDFLGPDIDIGFRIAKNAEKALLCLSAELASLLAGDENARLAAHDTLKGVWNGRPYPVIWFANDWARAKEHIWYDDEMRNAALAAVLKHDGRGHAGSLAGHLAKVLREVGLGTKVAGIRNVMSATEVPPPDDETAGRKAAGAAPRRRRPLVT